MSDLPALAPVVAALARLPTVRAVLLGGSRAAGQVDAASDVDLYVYSDGPLDADDRRRALAPCCGAMAWDNRFWEPEDDGWLSDGTPVDIVYRELGPFTAGLAAVVEQAQAGTGYTTCLWHNLRGSRILFDRTGEAAALQRRFDVPYPVALQRAIVAKNLPLIAASPTASYHHQIVQAVARGDTVSLNHRVAALLASYFDLVFAAAGSTHPGEKRLLAHLAALPTRPEAALDDVPALVALAVTAPAQLPARILQLDARLRRWLAETGLI